MCIIHLKRSKSRRKQGAMTLQLRNIKRRQWSRGWYVQLTEWIKAITTSKLKFKWMCFPHGGPWCSLHTVRGMKCGSRHLAHVSCLPHRCQTTADRSGRATSPCAASAATAARTTRAAVSAADSDRSWSRRNINLLCFFFLFFISPEKKNWPFLYLFFQCSHCSNF